MVQRNMNKSELKEKIRRMKMEIQELEECLDKYEERLRFIEKIMDDIRQQLKKEHIEAEVTGRAKHLYSIYRKMQRDNKTLDQIYDLFALRIIVNSVKDCYAALGVVHEMYSPMPGRFKDFSIFSSYTFNLLSIFTSKLYSHLCATEVTR